MFSVHHVDPNYTGKAPYFGFMVKLCWSNCRPTFHPPVQISQTCVGWHEITLAIYTSCHRGIGIRNNREQDVHCPGIGNWYNKTVLSGLAIRKKCSLPKLEEDVTVEPSHAEYEPAAVVKFSCGKRFLQIDGPASGKCQGNGKFNLERMPRCVRKWYRMWLARASMCNVPFISWLPSNR